MVGIRWRLQQERHTADNSMKRMLYTFLSHFHYREHTATPHLKPAQDVWIVQKTACGEVLLRTFRDASSTHRTLLRGGIRIPAPMCMSSFRWSVGSCLESMLSILHHVAIADTEFGRGVRAREHHNTMDSRAMSLAFVQLGSCCCGEPFADPRSAHIQ